MSLLDDIAKAGLGLVPTAIGALARMVGLKPVEPVPLIAPKHFFPPRNSVQEWAVGPDRCFYCLRYDRDHMEATKPPCSRKRPDPTELA